MPVISFFYGIIIRMFYRGVDRHNSPHIHAEYQGFTASFSISSGEILSGEFSKNKTSLVVAWIEIHREELQADWLLASSGQLEFKIRGLDD